MDEVELITGVLDWAGEKGLFFWITIAFAASILRGIAEGILNGTKTIAREYRETRAACHPADCDPECPGEVEEKSPWWERRRS